MEASKERKAHQGKNVRSARLWKDMKQEELGRLTNMAQSEISLWESKEKIKQPVLEQFAKALNVDINFLETFVPEEIYGTYNDFHNNTFTTNDNATDNVASIIQEINNSVPFEEIKALYDKLEQQYKTIGDLRVKLAENNIKCDLQ